MMENSKTQEGKDFFRILSEDFEQNGSLAQTLKNSGHFPNSMISYIKIGEETGCLDEVLKSLSEHYEQEIEISETIRSAVTYPLLMLAMMGTVIVILLVKVLPVFKQVFQQMGLEMNHFSNGLLSAGTLISRIVDVFEPTQQRQISIQLSMVLQAVISQQLIPDVNGHTIPVFEVMRLNPAIRNMIRDNKIHQIDGVIASSAHEHMRSMDQSLFELYRQRKITKETALKYASNADMLKRKLL